MKLASKAAAVVLSAAFAAPAFAEKTNPCPAPLTTAQKEQVVQAYNAAIVTVDPEAQLNSFETVRHEFRNVRDEYKAAAKDQGKPVSEKTLKGLDDAQALLLQDSRRCVPVPPQFREHALHLTAPFG